MDWLAIAKVFVAQSISFSVGVRTRRERLRASLGLGGYYDQIRPALLTAAGDDDDAAGTEPGDTVEAALRSSIDGRRRKSRMKRKRRKRKRRNRGVWRSRQLGGRIEIVIRKGERG